MKDVLKGWIDSIRLSKTVAAVLERMAQFQTTHQQYTDDELAQISRVYIRRIEQLHEPRTSVHEQPAENQGSGTEMDWIDKVIDSPNFRDGRGERIHVYDEHIRQCNRCDADIVWLTGKTSGKRYSVDVFDEGGERVCYRQEFHSKTCRR